MLLWRVLCVVVTVVMVSVGSRGANVGFSAPQLLGPGQVLSNEFQSLTSVSVAPDGVVYVATQAGLIFGLHLERDSTSGAYSVGHAERVDTLWSDLPNRDDTGVLNPLVQGRLVTGIAAVPHSGGRASFPTGVLIWVTSCDPRVFGKLGGTAPTLDLNSCVVSSLERDSLASPWTHKVWVRGLPRSGENHAVNGVAVVPDGTGDLLLAVGGLTNMGAPSFNLGYAKESPLSAALVRVNMTSLRELDAAGALPFDIPTLAPHLTPPDAGPFGSMEGKNIPVQPPGSPVYVYASGFRNPYDLLFTQDLGPETTNPPPGLLVSVDNDGNPGWGGLPIGCSNTPSEDTESGPAQIYLARGNVFHYVPAQGYYGGHPNPSRGDPVAAGFLNASDPVTSVVPAPNPVECGLHPDESAGLPLLTHVTSFDQSSNGMAQYTASNWNRSLTGSILVAGLKGVVFAVNTSYDPHTDTLSATSTDVLVSIGIAPLDIACASDTFPFPGIILVADFVQGLWVLEPNDFGGSGGGGPGGAGPCSGLVTLHLDDDNDGFSNLDEVLSETDPCDPASSPPDVDGDFVSNLLDPDDDNDGVPDVADVFPVDAWNGRGRPLSSHTASPPVPASVYSGTTGPVLVSSGPLESSGPTGSLVLSFDLGDAASYGSSLLSMGFTGALRGMSVTPASLNTRGVLHAFSQAPTPRSQTPVWDVADAANVIGGGAAGVFSLLAAPPGSPLVTGPEMPLQAGYGFGAVIGLDPVRFTVTLPSPFLHASTPSRGQSIGLYVSDGTPDSMLGACFVGQVSSSARPGVMVFYKDSAHRVDPDTPSLVFEGDTPGGSGAHVVAEIPLGFLEKGNTTLSSGSVILGLEVDLWGPVPRVQSVWSIDSGITWSVVGGSWIDIPAQILAPGVPLLFGVLASSSGFDPQDGPALAHGGGAIPFPVTFVDASLVRLGYNPMAPLGGGPGGVYNATLWLSRSTTWETQSTWQGVVYLRNDGEENIVSLSWDVSAAWYGVVLDPDQKAVQIESVVDTGTGEDVTSLGLVSLFNIEYTGVVRPGRTTRVKMSFSGFAPGLRVELGLDMDAVFSDYALPTYSHDEIAGPHLLGSAVSIQFSSPSPGGDGVWCRSTVGPPAVWNEDWEYGSEARFSGNAWPPSSRRPMWSQVTSPPVPLIPVPGGLAVESTNGSSITLSLDVSALGPGARVRTLVLRAARSPNVVTQPRFLDRLPDWALTSVYDSYPLADVYTDGSGLATIPVLLTDVWWEPSMDDPIAHAVEGEVIGYYVVFSCVDLPTGTPGTPGTPGGEVVCADPVTLRAQPPGEVAHISAPTAPTAPTAPAAPANMEGAGMIVGVRMPAPVVLRVDDNDMIIHVQLVPEMDTPPWGLSSGPSTLPPSKWVADHEEDIKYGVEVVGQGTLSFSVTDPVTFASTVPVLPFSLDAIRVLSSAGDVVFRPTSAQRLSIVFSSLGTLEADGGVVVDTTSGGEVGLVFAPGNPNGNSLVSTRRWIDRPFVWGHSEGVSIVPGGSTGGDVTFRIQLRHQQLTTLSSFFGAPSNITLQVPVLFGPSLGTMPTVGGDANVVVEFTGSPVATVVVEDEILPIQCWEVPVKPGLLPVAWGAECGAVIPVSLRPPPPATRIPPPPPSPPPSSFAGQVSGSFSDGSGNAGEMFGVPVLFVALPAVFVFVTIFSLLLWYLYAVERRAVLIDAVQHRVIPPHTTHTPHTAHAAHTVHTPHTA